MNEHLKEGDAVPEVIFKTREGDTNVCGDATGKWVDLTTAEVFSGKKVVVFALPGAYTPTCSGAHLPGYERAYDEFKSLGIDEIYCLSVNDAYVMKQWAIDLTSPIGGTNNVKMLPDGNTDFTRGMGMLVEKRNLGFGERSWRYSMLVEDGVIRKMFVEPGMTDNANDDPFEVSNAETMLQYLQENK